MIMTRQNLRKETSLNLKKRQEHLLENEEVKSVICKVEGAVRQAVKAGKYSVCTSLPDNCALAPDDILSALRLVYPDLSLSIIDRDAAWRWEGVPNLLVKVGWN